MLYFQMFVIAIGLFVLSDPFKAVTVEEETASGTWQVAPSLTAKPKTLPVQEDSNLQGKKAKAQ